MSFNFDSTNYKFDSRSGYTYESFFVSILFSYLTNKLLNHANINCLSENELRYKYGAAVSGIDHLIIDKVNKKIFAVQQKLRSETVPTAEVDSFISSINYLEKIFNYNIIPIFVSTRKSTSIVISREYYSTIKWFVFINPEIAVRNSINYIFEGRIIYEDVSKIEDSDCVMD